MPSDFTRVFDADLAAAGIPKTDAHGRTLDIHCLRHTFATLLARNGASPSVAQKLLRHSDIRLTTNIYTHLDLADTAGAVAALPAFWFPPIEAGAGWAPTRRSPGNWKGSCQTAVLWIEYSVLVDKYGSLYPIDPMATEDRQQKARAIFRKHRGLLRTKDAIRLGIHPRTLYSMRDAGEIQQVGRGHFRLSDLPQFGNPDLVAVALAVPKGVVCLISALSFHGIGTQIPRVVDVAIEKDTKRPQIEYPPVRTLWFGGSAFKSGVQIHDLDGVPIRIYSPAKTVADCFKCRNKIGLDVALEALREVRRSRLAWIFA